MSKISDFSYDFQILFENQHLRSIKFSPLTEFKIIENTLFPSHIRNSIANSIRLLHCFEKQVSLFISRQKFNFQCQLHSAKILNNFTYQKIIINFVKQFNYGAAIPPIGSKADQWVSLPKII